MNRLLIRYGLSCLCLAVVGVSASFARQAPPPAPRPTVRAWLELRFDRRGGVRATLRLPFQPPVSPVAWQHVLRLTLNAPLDRVREEQTRWRWSLHAHAGAVLQRSGWTIEGAIDLRFLLRFLKVFGVGQLSVSVQHPSADFSDCSLNDAPFGRNILNTNYSSDVPVAPLPPPMRLAFGYRPADAWKFLPLAIVPLVPIALTLWRRRRRVGEEDRFEAWFRYWRLHSWLVTALWCVWLVAVPMLGALNLGGFILCGLFPSGEVVWLALFLLLPLALAVLVCKMLSAPAFAGVPEIGWTRGRLFQQALWGQLGFVAAGVCLAYGVDAWSDGPYSHWGWLTIVAALGLFLLCLAGWFQSRNLVLGVLPPGELRERLFELAEQIQVRVRQAYLLPAAGWRLLNVVGVFGEFVHLTAEVLPHLSRREVDALLAMELARLWRRGRRALWRTLGFFLLLIVFSIAAGFLAAFAGGDWYWQLLPLVFLVSMALRFRVRGGHFAPILDRGALAITGDPEALLTALAKLHRLQLVPLGIGKAFAGPAEDWPRLQELADRAGIPPERLREILDRPGSGEDRYPPLPAAPDTAADADPRVFSRDFKRRALAWQSWTGLALEIATPALVAFFVQWLRWGGVPLAVAYLLGLPLTVLLRRRGVHYMAVRTSLALRRGIRNKLVTDGMEPDAWDGILVGLSPHAEPRSYESFLSWDLGFLVLAGDRLCYLGDRMRFALDRAHIQDVYLGPGAPGWQERVYVTWRDDKRGIGGTFNLTMSEARSAWRSGPSAADLAKRLRDWLRQPVDAADLSLPLRELPAPDFGAVASESLGKLAAGNILVFLLAVRAPFAIGACLLLNLSFDPDAGAAGWYVLGSVALVQLWTVLSFRRYRGGKRDDMADADALAPRRD